MEVLNAASNRWSIINSVHQVPVIDLVTHKVVLSLCEAFVHAWWQESNTVLFISSLVPNHIALPQVYASYVQRRRVKYKWCSRLQFCTFKAMLGQEQPELMRWILIWTMLQVQDRSFDIYYNYLHSGALPLSLISATSEEIKCILWDITWQEIMRIV